MAVTLTVAELEEALDTDTATATRLLAVSSALVEREAPEAPATVSNEAAIRAAGWLLEQPAASVTSDNAGPLSRRFTHTRGALRHSGARSLVSAWKVRRAGAIG